MFDKVKEPDTKQAQDFSMFLFFCLFVCLDFVCSCVFVVLFCFLIVFCEVEGGMEYSSHTLD